MGGGRVGRRVALGLGWLAISGSAVLAHAESLPGMSLSLGMGSGTGEVASAVKVFLFLTLLSVAPSIILTMTSFTRIVIVLSFLRQAIGVHQSPPNQVVVGLALFLSMFIMAPVFKQVQTDALSPLFANKITAEEAFNKATPPLKQFMVVQTREADLMLMLDLAKVDKPKDIAELPMSALIPAFILSELKTAFEIGFLIYLPFVLIDMVVSMVLLTMGMMVLPPVIISLPFKLMLFVLVDGWNLLVGALVRSFRGVV